MITAGSVYMIGFLIVMGGLAMLVFGMANAGSYRQQVANIYRDRHQKAQRDCFITDPDELARRVCEVFPGDPQVRESVIRSGDRVVGCTIVDGRGLFEIRRAALEEQYNNIFHLLKSDLN